MNNESANETIAYIEQKLREHAEFMMKFKSIKPDIPTDGANSPLE